MLELIYTKIQEQYMTLNKHPSVKMGLATASKHTMSKTSNSTALHKSTANTALDRLKHTLWERRCRAQSRPSRKSQPQPKMQPELKIETYQPHEKVSAGVVTVLNIKLQEVKQDDLTADEQSQRCTICLDDFFPAPEPRRKPVKRRSIRFSVKPVVKKPKVPRVVRLLPCGHLFHNKCIGEHVVSEKSSDDIPLVDEDPDQVEDDEEDLAEDIAGYEFATNSTTFFFERNNLARPGDDGYVPLPVENDNIVATDIEDVDPADTTGMIEFEGGWRSVDGERVIRKDTSIIVSCPVCKSHILPSEDQWDFKEEWAKKERHFAKQWFRDPTVGKSDERLARSGKAAVFTEDLKAAREFARKMTNAGA